MLPLQSVQILLKSARVSSDPATVLYKIQSSAKRHTFDVKLSARSLIKMRNINGPVTVP